jgi:hypothetical protein
MSARSALTSTTLTLLALTLAACGPSLPKGVKADKLDQWVSDQIGDPNTCVLIGRQGSGDVVWRYNTHTACARTFPACDAPGAQSVNDLLKATAKDGRARTLSCNTTADASRGVGWASGALPRHGFVYAAVMEGQNALPGRIMAEKLDGVFKDAGL